MNTHTHQIRSKRGFTLVEIMIVVVIIAILAALAIPAFQSVRERSRSSTLVNDARQLGSAAQQYFLEANMTRMGLSSNYDSATGVLSGPFPQYVRQIGRGYTLDSDITINTDWTMAHLQARPEGGTVGAAFTFTDEGQLTQTAGTD